MAELRWALLLLGAVFLAGLGLWEWRRGAPRASEEFAAAAEPVRDEPRSSRPEPLRREPVIGEFGSLGTLPSHGPAAAGDDAGLVDRIGIAIEERSTCLQRPGRCRRRWSRLSTPCRKPRLTSIRRMPSTEARSSEQIPTLRWTSALDADLETRNACDLHRVRSAADTRWPPMCNRITTDPLAAGPAPDRVAGTARVRAAPEAAFRTAPFAARCSRQACGLVRSDIYHLTDARRQRAGQRRQPARPGSLRSRSAWTARSSAA